MIKDKGKGDGWRDGNVPGIIGHQPFRTLTCFYLRENLFKNSVIVKESTRCDTFFLNIVNLNFNIVLYYY